MPALPSYLGHMLTDSRRGLVVNVQASAAVGSPTEPNASAARSNSCWRHWVNCVGLPKAPHSVLHLHQANTLRFVSSDSGGSARMHASFELAGDRHSPTCVFATMMIQNLGKGE